MISASLWVQIAAGLAVGGGAIALGRHVFRVIAMLRSGEADRLEAARVASEALPDERH